MTSTIIEGNITAAAKKSGLLQIREYQIGKAAETQCDNRQVILGLDHVQLAAPPGCEARARWFFGEVLGMQELEKPEELARRGGCWFAAGDQQLHIGVEPDFRPAKKAHPAFRVKYMIVLKTRLNSYKIAFREDEANPGVKRIFVEDPWGNRLEFVE